MPTGDVDIQLDGGKRGSSDEFRNEHIPLENSPYSSRRTVLWALLVTAITSVAFVLAAFLLRTGSPTSIKSTSCAGKTAEELQRDCAFDIISFSWLPPECFDAELSAEWEDLRTWEYYTSINGTEVVPIETVRLGHLELYSTWEQHLQHCIFMWRKFNRAVAEGRPVDGYSGANQHTLHCGTQLMEAARTDEPLDSVNSFITIKAPECGAVKG